MVSMQTCITVSLNRHHSKILESYINYKINIAYIEMKNALYVIAGILIPIYADNDVFIL